MIERIDDDDDDYICHKEQREKDATVAQYFMENRYYRTVPVVI